jgi:hypothetical protein
MAVPFVGGTAISSMGVAAFHDGVLVGNGKEIGTVGKRADVNIQKSSAKDQQFTPAIRIVRMMRKPLSPSVFTIGGHHAS